MKTIILALRNIFRNRRRTSITCLAIISGMTGLIVFGGFIEFAFYGLRETTIRTQLGHLQVYKKGYSEHGVAEPGKFLIDNADNVVERLSELPGINIVTSRTTFSGLISTGDKTLSFKGIGIDYQKEEDEMSTFEIVIDGEQLSSETEDGGVVGVELVKGLGAELGDYLTILTNTTDGMINAGEFQLTGVAQTGSQDYDSVFIKLPLEKVQNLLNTDKVEKIIVLLDDTEMLDEVIPALDEIIASHGLDVEYKTWRELAFYYNKVVNLYNGLFGAIKVIIGIIVLFSIANTMSMSVYERVREIGTLRALGSTRLTIMKLFITEGIFIGVLGSLLGIAAGIATAFAINMNGGIYIPPPPGMSSGYQSIILIVPSVLLYSFLLTVCVACLSSIPPAFRAARLNIVDALHHV